jgi:hypothetical protein
MNKKMKKQILEDDKSVIITPTGRVNRRSGEVSSWSVDREWDSLEDVNINNILR